MYVPSLDQMMDTFGANMPSLLSMVAGIAFIIGIVLVVQAMYTFKQYGDMRTFSASSTDFRGPATMFIMGALLIWLPTSIDMGIATFWDGGNILMYQPVDATTDQARLLKTLLNVMTVVGTISFVRGIVLLSRTGSRQGTQPGQFARGISHLIAGIMAINLYASWDVLLNTFGISV